MPDEMRDGVKLTNLDGPVFDGAGVTKRQLVDYYDAMADRLVPVLAGRPLSVIRAHRGQEPFMQKNVPKGTPDWVKTVTMWAESSKRDVTYAVCDDRRTLLWFGNQRAVELHPALAPADDPAHITHLVMDLDPPEGAGFDVVVATARLVHQAMDDVGLAGAVKTSGSKGLHVFVPIEASTSPHDAAAATRALAERAVAVDPTLATTAFMKEDREGKVFVDYTRAGGATVVAAYSPRFRPGCPVSFPVPWGDLDGISPRDFTILTAPDVLGDTDPWAAQMPAPQALPADLVDEGTGLPTPRVEAMHEGKRRKRAASAKAQTDE